MGWFVTQKLKLGRYHETECHGRHQELHVPGLKDFIFSWERNLLCTIIQLCTILKDPFNELISSGKYCIDISPLGSVSGFTVSVQHYLSSTQMLTLKG